MLDFARVQDIIRRVAHRFDPQVLEAMLDLPPLSVAAFADPTGIAAWLSRLQGRLNATGLGRPRYRLEARAPVNDQPGALIVNKSHNGLESTQVLPATSFESGDLKALRSEEHTSELQSLMRISYDVFCLKKQNEQT